MHYYFELADNVLSPTHDNFARPISTMHNFGKDAKDLSTHLKSTKTGRASPSVNRWGDFR
jgi:hypothetical protein